MATVAEIQLVIADQLFYLLAVYTINASHHIAPDGSIHSNITKAVFAYLPNFAKRFIAHQRIHYQCAILELFLSSEKLCNKYMRCKL